LDTSCYRGLSLPDPLAPFIAINDNDARPAWSFSLLHEFVHLLLGRGYCSGARDDSAVERFCDDVASLYLLPPEPIDQFDAAGMKVEVAITGIADQWRVSRALVAFRLLRAGKIAQNDYRRLVAQFRQAWLLNRQQMREKNRYSVGAPTYSSVGCHRPGRALLALMPCSHFECAVSTTRAATVLGVKPTQLGSMLKVGSA